MKPSLKAGIAVGLATGGWMFAEYALGLHDDPDGGAGRWTGFLSLIFPVMGAWWLAAKTASLSWKEVALEGLLFGGLGGLIGGAAIYLYYAVLNPGFQVGGQPVDAGAQTVAGFIGALILGLILVLVFHAVAAWRKKPNV